MPRTTQVMSFSLFPEDVKEFNELVKRQRTTKSRLFREMIRAYQIKAEVAEYEELLQYGQGKARELGVESEEDIERLIHETRNI